MDDKILPNSLINSLNQGIPLEWNHDHFRLENWKGRILRWILPGYSQKKDCIAANQLTSLILKDSHSQFRDGDLLKVCEIFHKKHLSSYYFPNKELKKITYQMKNLIFMMKLSLQFNLPIDLLRQNPDFVEFAEANHLHRRIDSSYQKRGFGITLEKDQICLKYFNPNNPSEPLSRPWSQMRMDATKKIIGMALFAYGWESLDTTLSSLKPITVIDSSQAPARGLHPCIELNSTLPTYDITRIHSIPLGHSYIKLYEPLMEKGCLTNQVAVYILGYAYHTIVTPDLVEFIDRKKIVTTEKLNVDQFNHIKKIVANLLLHQKNPNFVPSTAREKIKHLYAQFYYTTCVNFACVMLQEATGIQLNGRLSIMKLLFPEVKPSCFDRLRNKAPRFFQGLIKQMEFFICGYFPIPLIREQEKLLIRQTSNQI